jgi:DNA-binding MarR family transcriptional regulator
VAREIEPKTVGIAESKALLRDKLVREKLVESDVLDRMEVMFELMRLAPRLTRDYDRIHRANGWTYAGFRIVNQLWILGDLEPGDLARLLGASPASISSALRTLEASGYIERHIKTTDRRLIEVSLTTKGREILPRAIAEQAKREAAWLDVLTPAQRATFAKLITRLAEQPDVD